MEFNSLINCLQENGVSIHPNFAKAYQANGCIEAYREIFDGIVEDMARCASLAVNSTAGFNGAIRKGIKELSDLLVYVSNENTIANIAKISERRVAIKRKMLPALNKILPGESTMAEELLERIALYKSGIEYQLKRDFANDRKEILRTCIVRLGELEAALGDVVDVSSPAALKYAEEILAELKAWEVVVAQLRHNAATPEVISRLTAKAKKWSEELVMAKKTSFFAFLSPSRKTIDIESVIFDENDVLNEGPLASIGLVFPILENVEIFKHNLQDFKKHVEAGLNASEYENKIAEIKKKIADLQNEGRELASKLDNGEISHDEFVRRGTTLSDKITDLTYQLEAATEKLAGLEEEKDLYRANIETLADLLDVVNKYKETDPEAIAVIGDCIDFEKLSNVMTGSFSATDEASVELLTSAAEIVNQDRIDNLHGLKMKRRAAAEEKKKRRLEKKAPIQSEEDLTKQENDLFKVFGYNSNRSGVQTGSTPDNQNKNDQNGNRNEGFRP